MRKKKEYQNQVAGHPHGNRINPDWNDENKHHPIMGAYIQILLLQMISRILG